MPTVSVPIGGRLYRMACDEGEEQHLQGLASHVDQTLVNLRKSFGEIGDQRLTIMTAVSIADELTMARRRIAELEMKLGLANRDSGDGMRDKLAADIAVLLDGASERIEALARRLKSGDAE